MASSQPKTFEAAKAWVEAGKPCTHRYGLSFRGAQQGRITTEEARELLKKHKTFECDFWTLMWSTFEGEEVLCFQEYGENDLY